MTRINHWLSTDRALCLLLALFVLLGTLYSVTTPIFEAGDELWHYPYVQWLSRGSGLPVQEPAQKQLWEQEGGQPPLYYVLSAALTFWVNTSDLSERLWRNPYAQIGIPLAFGNKNMVVHTSAENFPWQGAALAVHLIRILSVLFSAGTVLLTYHIARELLSRSSHVPRPSSLALLAASFVAFNPMFLFISASVNNDSLAALLATASLYLTLQLVTRAATSRRVLLLGIVVGLAILTKVSNLALGIVVEAVLIYCAWRGKNFVQFLRSTFYFLLPILILDAWWFVRNYLLYGDPTAFNVWLQIAGGRPPQTLLGLLDEFQGFRISFWGNFGGVNVIAPDFIYTTLDIFTILAFAGLVLGALRRTLPALLWIPALHLTVVFIALVRWTLLTYASQGRLIFPAIASLALLFAVGLYELSHSISQFTSYLWHLTPTVSRSTLDASRSPSATSQTVIGNQRYDISAFLPALLALLLFLFALAAPFYLIAPVYAQPPRLADETRVPNPVHITFDAGAAQPELVGFDTVRFLQPGHDLPITLYWRTASPIPEDLKMYIHLFDIRGKLIGQWDAFPGNGLLPTRLWQPGEIIVDEYHVPVQNSGAYPPVGRIEVGMSRFGSSFALPAHNPQGQTITPSLALFKFSHRSSASGTPQVVVGAPFNLLNLGFRVQRGIDNLQAQPNDRGVTPVRAGELLNIGLVLQARKIPDADYTLFAHLVDANGTIVSQRDAQPLENSYPTTLWDQNEQVADILQLDIPRDASGSYTIEFGIYRASDLQRLPMTGQDFDVWHVQTDHLAAPLEVNP